MNKSKEEWSKETQHAYDSILFGHNPIEVDKQFAELLESVLTKLTTHSQNREDEIRKEERERLLKMFDEFNDEIEFEEMAQMVRRFIQALTPEQLEEQDPLLALRDRVVARYQEVFPNEKPPTPTEPLQG